MNIALIIYGSLNTLTGGWIFDRLLVEHLRRQGHTVTVISLKQRRYVLNLADNFWHPLGRRLRELDCRLLLEDGLCHPSLFILNRRIRQNRGRPVIAVIHQVLCRQPLSWHLKLLYQACERGFARSVDGFIFNSATSQRNMGSLMKRPRPAIVACPGGDRLGRLASESGIASKCSRPGPLNLIMVANLTPNKGVLALLEALARLPQEIWHLDIVGSLAMDRGYAEKVRTLIRRRGLAGRVNLRGTLDGEALVKAFTRSHVFVLPFSYEAFGMACLEAMAWGLPVIGSSAGALKEFVADGINGLLVPPGDHATFARHVSLLHRRRDLLTSYAQAAFHAFGRRPTWQDSLRKIHTFLLTMADQGAAGTI